MNTEPKRINYSREYVVATGYIIFFCILVAACLGLFYISRSQYSPPINEFATILPLMTPNPHISSVDEFETSSILFRDDFDNNQNHWLNSQDDTKEKIDNGRLFFQSRYDGDISIISCESCLYMKTPYYLETSLSTNFATDEDYGIVFKHSHTLDDYYLFMINPESRKFFLFHHAPEEWSLRSSGESKLIRPYPDSNTLGLYANQDIVEFYINGVIIDSYTESGNSFHGGFFGIYTSSSSFGVFVDKVVIYKIGE